MTTEYNLKNLVDPRQVERLEQIETNWNNRQQPETIL